MTLDFAERADATAPTITARKFHPAAKLEEIFDIETPEDETAEYLFTKYAGQDIGRAFTRRLSRRGQ